MTFPLAAHWAARESSPLGFNAAVSRIFHIPVRTGHHRPFGKKMVLSRAMGPPGTVYRSPCATRPIPVAARRALWATGPDTAAASPS